MQRLCQLDDSRMIRAVEALALCKLALCVDDLLTDLCGDFFVGRLSKRLESFVAEELGQRLQVRCEIASGPNRFFDGCERRLHGNPA